MKENMAEAIIRSWSTLCRLVCVLACTIGITGVPTAATDCTSVVGIRADFVNNTFVCSDPTSSKDFTWTLLLSENVTVPLANCRQDISSCNVDSSPISSSLNCSLGFDDSQLVINTQTPGINFREFFNGSIIKCQTRFAEQNWTTDFVYPGTAESCHVQFRRDTWRVSGSCVVKDIFSASGCYKCLWIRSSSSSFNSSSEVEEVGQLRAVDPQKRSATCELDASFPLDQGRYSYGVEMTHTTSRINVSFLGTDEIRRPLGAAQLNHTCPLHGVAEGSDLRCQCKAAGGDMGSPNATAVWRTSGNSSDLMTLLDVSRTDTGSQYECNLMWNKTSFSSLTYVLSTYCTEEKCGGGPSRSQARGEGIGIGFTICLAVLAVALGVLALVQWRRGKSILGQHSCFTVDCCRGAQEVQTRGGDQNIAKENERFRNSHQTQTKLYRRSNETETKGKGPSQTNQYEKTDVVKNTMKPATPKRIDTSVASTSGQTKERTSHTPAVTDKKKGKSDEPAGENYEPVDFEHEPQHSYEMLGTFTRSSRTDDSKNDSSTTEGPPEDVYQNPDETDEPQQLYGNT